MAWPQFSLPECGRAGGRPGSALVAHLAMGSFFQQFMVLEPVLCSGVVKLAQLSTNAWLC